MVYSSINGLIIAFLPMDTGMKKLFDTASHIDVLRHLGMLTHSLLVGKFAETAGVNTQLLLGPRGVGKTKTFRVFASLAPIVYGARLIPFYISFESISDDKNMSLLSYRSLTEIIPKVLTNQISLNQVPKELEGKGEGEEGRYCLLLVDEMDFIYCNEPGTAIGKAMLGSLGALRRLTTTIYGARIAVTGTGSSHALPLLISKKALDYPQLKSRFPLVTKSFDMNDTKFRSFSIDVVEPIDVTATSAILGMNMNTEADKHTLEVITFLVGNNPRTLEQAQGSSAEFITFAVKLISKLLVKTRETTFYVQLLQLFYQQNEELFESIQQEEGDDEEGPLDFSKINSTTMAKFKPITCLNARTSCSDFTVDALTTFIDDGFCLELGGRDLWPCSLYLVDCFQRFRDHNPLKIREAAEGALKRALQRFMDSTSIALGARIVALLTGFRIDFSRG